MNWDALGAIGEIIGAVAVLATLFYLAAQIKMQNRQLERSNENVTAQSVSYTHLTLPTKA